MNVLKNDNYLIRTMKKGTIATMNLIILTKLILFLATSNTLAQSEDFEERLTQCDRYAEEYSKQNVSGGGMTRIASGASAGALGGLIWGGNRGAGRGAAVGAVMGAIPQGKTRRERKRELYDSALKECMQAKSF